MRRVESLFPEMVARVMDLYMEIKCKGDYKAVAKEILYLAAYIAEVKIKEEERLYDERIKHC